jgi:chaperone required for assembly of F1-ATPase
LWDLQRQQWDPVLHWFQDEFDVKLPIVAGVIIPPEIPDETMAVIRRELMSYRFDAILGKFNMFGVVQRA